MGFDFDFIQVVNSLCFFGQQKISKRCHLENRVICIILFLKNEEQNSKQMAFQLLSGLFSYILIEGFRGKRAYIAFLADFHFLQDRANFWQTDLF